MENNTTLEKLEGLVSRFEEVATLITDPAVIADQERYVKLTGSRIMGGGFGGCTINLVKEGLYDKFIADAKEKYRNRYGKEPKVYDVVISDGSRKIC